MPEGADGLTAGADIAAAKPGTSALDLLKEPRFARLWATVEFSFLGMFIHVVACGWILMEMTGSATLVSLIQTAYALPIVLFSMLAGAMADTFDRRRTMVLSLTVSLAGSVGLVAASAAEMLTPWSILGLMFVVGSGVAIFTPSWQASLGELVPRERLVDAVALHNMGANLMRTLGPSLGGILIAATTPVLTFALGAASYLPALVSLVAWRHRPAHRDDLTEPLGTAMMTGLRFLLASPHLQTLLIRVFAFSAIGISIMSLLPLVTQNQLGLGAESYGLLFGGFGLGAITGGLVTGRLRQRLSTEQIVRVAIGLNTAALALLAVSPGFWPAVIACFLAGSCWLTSHSLQNSALQLATPRWVVGRMVAMFLSAAFLGLSAGAWAWGVIAGRLGTASTLAIAALAMGATLLMARRWPLPGPHTQSMDALHERKGVVDLPNLHPSLGPLQVQIEHRLSPGATARFHEVMEHRRRHLGQLGARDWTLMHDLANGDAWIETYWVATWRDYQRLMARRTQQTAQLREDVRRVQASPNAMVIRVLLTATRSHPLAEPMLRT